MGLNDPRKRKDYSLAELVVGGVMLFVFKEGSRNAFDNDRREAMFRKNYQRAFKLRLPGMDAVEDLYRLLDESELESLKHLLVKTLIEKKMFYKFRFMGKKYFVAIDGTGVASYETDYCGECTSKTSKSGKTTYSHNVLEAKLVTHNGMSVSIATEWVRNENGKEYDKQDCELNAFKRLAVKLKKVYPRLPLVILADGLYANQSFFRICKDNGWGFIVTFKDGSLPSVNEEMGLLPGSAWRCRERFLAGKGKRTKQSFRWINGIGYRSFELSVAECKETTVHTVSGVTEENTFTHITDMPIDNSNYHLVSQGGRMRWNIENSFDYLKEHGYNLGHKFSRSSFRALKNYYQSMLLAHTINQFVEKSTGVAALLAAHSKETIANLWKRLLAYFSENKIKRSEYEKLLAIRYQVRLE
ncbi:MAG TPA: transposase [Draconibacterium sp.]|nr:transposase [Draconibacterium sp.]